MQPGVYLPNLSQPCTLQNIAALITITMAVIEECPGVKAQVLVARRPLQEYDDEDEETVPNVTTKYIEARSGEEFVLKWTFSEPFQKVYGVRVGVKIDGDKPNSRVYPPEDLFRVGGHNKPGVGLKKDGNWYRRNYRFTALNIGIVFPEVMRELKFLEKLMILLVEEIADGSRMGDLRRDVETKGCITLTFHFIDNMVRDVRTPRAFDAGYLRSMGDLPEKALKGDARSHQTT